MLVIKKNLFKLLCISLVLSTSYVFAQVSAGAYKPDSYPPDVQRIFSRGELIVAMYEKDLFPFFYKASDGTLQGFDIDLAKKIAKELDVKLRFVNSPDFEGVIDLVASRKADMAISHLSVTSKRALRCRFSKPYLESATFLIENGKGRSPSSDNAIFVELETSSYIGFAKHTYPECHVITKPDWDSVMKALVKGEAQYSIRDEIGAKTYINDNRRYALHLNLIPLDEVKDFISIALPSDSVQLEHWINLFLDMNDYPKSADYVFKKYGDKK